MEREALSLIHFLRDQGQPQSEWLNALSSDQTLSAPTSANAPCNSLANGNDFGVRCVSTALDSLAQPLDFRIARIQRHPKKVAPRQIQSSADTEHSKAGVASGA